MPLPAPFSGLVLHYSYLWHEQHQRGMEEGSKDRPCVVVLAVTNDDGETAVTVLPITHSPPHQAGEAVELPAATKGRMGLDDGRSWIVVARPVPAGEGRICRLGPVTETADNAAVVLISSPKNDGNQHGL